MDSPVLETQHISKSFGALIACDDVSIDLKPGEIHAIIGPNGAGKSTLIKQICGNIKPDQGTVLLNGQDVTALSTQDRARRGMGRTFQISALAMDDSVLENVLLGRIGASGSAMRLWSATRHDDALVSTAMSVLERVGLQQKADVITSELSHGERRQLEVAISLSLNPKVFIMDEPMAGLGEEGSRRMTEFLKELKNEAPILLVEHDMDAVFALANRISVLVYGKVITSGKVEEIRAHQEVREAYLGEQE